MFQPIEQYLFPHVMLFNIHKVKTAKVEDCFNYWDNKKAKYYFCLQDVLCLVREGGNIRVVFIYNVETVIRDRDLGNNKSYIDDDEMVKV